MLFNSLQFAVFLPIVILFYFLLPSKYRWILLLASSYYFYMCWRMEYVFLILASTLVDYISGIQMEKTREKPEKRFWLFLSLLVNLGLLFSFKYFNFFSEAINITFDRFNIINSIPSLNILLPVGISFYTFQTLSYTIEVYMGKQKAEKHLGYFALYVSFFPQLVAGPIERYSRLAPQLRANHTFSYDNLVRGLRLILYGLFIKMVIADNLSVYVDRIYAAPEDFSSLSILTGLFFYSFQIYSDFFGYSTIAIGTALIMGIKIMDNFRTPYLARNISEFWQRWHISLSTWFRDYVYFPLGGNRAGLSKWIINILIVFTVSGLWHGANWTFIFWGALFGVIYLLEKLSNYLFRIKPERRVYSPGHLLLAGKTFLLVTFIWVFFRSTSIDQSFQIFSLMINNVGLADSFDIAPRIWIFLSLFIVSDLVLYDKRFDTWVGGKSLVVRWVLYIFLIFSIIVFSGVENFPFIYFQF